MKTHTIILLSISALLFSACAEVEDTGSPLTLRHAVQYAESTVLVNRVVRDDQIHSYVKEVWRFGSGADAPPVGSEYGPARPYDSAMRDAESDAIVFRFGTNRPKGLPAGWTVPVEQGRVPAIQKVSYERRGLRSEGDVNTIEEPQSEPMSVNEVRNAVKNTKPISETPTRRD